MKRVEMMEIKANSMGGVWPIRLEIGASWVEAAYHHPHSDVFVSNSGRTRGNTPANRMAPRFPDVAFEPSLVLLVAWVFCDHVGAVCYAVSGWSPFPIPLCWLLPDSLSLLVRRSGAVK